MTSHTETPGTSQEAPASPARAPSSSLGTRRGDLEQRIRMASARHWADALKRAKDPKTRAHILSCWGLSHAFGLTVAPPEDCP